MAATGNPRSKGRVAQSETPERSVRELVRAELAALKAEQEVWAMPAGTQATPADQQRMADQQRLVPDARPSAVSRVGDLHGSINVLLEEVYHLEQSIGPVLVSPSDGASMDTAAAPEEMSMLEVEIDSATRRVQGATLMLMALRARVLV